MVAKGSSMRQCSGEHCDRRVLVSGRARHGARLASDCGQMRRENVRRVICASDRGEDRASAKEPRRAAGSDGAFPAC